MHIIAHTPFIDLCRPYWYGAAPTSCASSMIMPITHCALFAFGRVQREHRASSSAQGRRSLLCRNNVLHSPLRPCVRIISIASLHRLRIILYCIASAGLHQHISEMPHCTLYIQPIPAMHPFAYPHAVYAQWRYAATHASPHPAHHTPRKAL